MRLWTILTEAAWKSLNDRGYLICKDGEIAEESSGLCGFFNSNLV
jgi:hypothetical protein